MIQCIIIDDESFNRELIRDFITRLNPAYHIIGEADNIDSASDMIRKLKPDLIFLDIKMPGGSGFDLLARFDTNTFEVVFVTGFDEYAIKAFEFNAMDYVLKPIDQSKFKNTLQQVKHRFDNRLSNVYNLKDILKTYDRKDAIITKIPVHRGHEVILLDVDNLMYVEAEDGYTIFMTKDEERYTSSRKLSEFEFILDAYAYFVQVNKGIYINLRFVKSYSKGEVCIIKLINDTTFEVSRRKKTEILALLDRK
jgi:two-component system LytT family response regulator